MPKTYLIYYGLITMIAVNVTECLKRMVKITFIVTLVKRFDLRISFIVKTIHI